MKRTLSLYDINLHKILGAFHKIDQDLKQMSD